MTGPSPRIPVLLVLVWVGGLVVATSVGLLAVRLVAAQVGDPAVAPLPAVVAASAGASASTAPTPSPPAATPPASPPPAIASPAAVAAATRTFATAAGTLGVQCTGRALRLLYATPAQGYALDERSVTGSEAEVRFESSGGRVRVRLSCATGAPQLVEQRTDPDGGGDDEPEGDDD